MTGSISCLAITHVENMTAGVRSNDSCHWRSCWHCKGPFKVCHLLCRGSWLLCFLPCFVLLIWIMVFTLLMLHRLVRAQCHQIIFIWTLSRLLMRYFRIQCPFVLLELAQKRVWVRFQHFFLILECKLFWFQLSQFLANEAPWKLYLLNLRWIWHLLLLIWIWERW